MKRVYLLKVCQHSSVRYIGREDPRTLVRMAKKAEMRAVQEAQRPIDPVRLTQIAAYVETGGTLSTSLVIGTTDDRIQVVPVEQSGAESDLYYTDFPETEQEFDRFKDSFELMDGQHRLYSFLPEYCKVTEDIPYMVSFEMYLMPTMREKRLIFKNTNEKQKSVAANLLLWFRDKLGMLTPKEKTYHSVVAALNQEAQSPLRGRIIMGAERVVGGYKENQVIDILSKTDVKNVIPLHPLSDEAMFRLISQYLSGWEKAVGAKIAERDKNLGAFSKTAGLRYMVTLLPAFYEQAVKNNQKMTSDFVCQAVKDMYNELYGITPMEFFDRNSDYNQRANDNPFASETATLALAKQHANSLKAMTAPAFDALP